MLKRIFHIAWLLTVALLVLAAVALTAARLWVPSLADYRHEIEREAGAQLGRTVTIDSMQATWRGLHPVLKLRDIAVSQPDNPMRPFSIDEIWLRLDIRHYLQQREVRFIGVDVIGVDLALVRDAAGNLQVEQFRDLAAGDGDVFDTLAKMARVSLHESVITYRDELSPRSPLRFSPVMLSLENDGDVRRLTGYAGLPGEFGYRVELNARFTGSDPDMRTWQGRAYLTGQQLSLPSLLDYWKAGPTARGIADMRLWLDVDSGRVSAASGEIDLRELHVERAAGDVPVRFDADTVGLRIGWQQSDSDWQAVVHMLSATQETRRWSPFDIILSGGQRGELGFVRVTSPQIVLDDLWQMLPLMPIVDAQQFSKLAGLKLAGELIDLDVMLLKNEHGMRLGNVDARFSEFGVAETESTPYLAGLDGMVSGSGDVGRLVLDSRDVDMSDSRLFRDILAFNELQGELGWQREDDALVFESERLALVNPDMALLANLALSLPPGDAAAVLDLSIDVETLQVGRVRHYLPAKVMSGEGVKWLDRSLLAGEVRNGTVRVQGRLDQIPYDNGEGVLEVRLPVFNAVLDFNEDWTPITDLDAQVDFTGRSMDITSSAGLIRTASLQQVRARIADLAQPFLTIDGGVRGQLPVMLAELGSSPLGERFGGFVDRARTTGACGLVLDIDIPLQGQQREITAAGRITLRNNSLKIADSEIALTKMNGVLAFDGDGIEGDGLTTELYDRPADVRVWGEPGSPDTRIRLTGRLGLLDKLLGESSDLRKALSGESDWQVDVTLRGTPARGEEGDVGVSIVSSLNGTAVDLPSPLGKPAAASRRLSITVDNAAKKLQRTTLAYGDQLHGILLLDSSGKQTRLRRGTLTLGGGRSKLHDRDELLVNGRVEVLPLSAWQGVLGGGGEGADVPVRLDLEVGALDVLGYRAGDLHLAAAAAGRAWKIDVSGEQSHGKVEVVQTPQRLEKVVLNMERLAISKSPAAGAGETVQAAPSDMPDLQVTAGEFIYNDANFGQVDLKAAAVADNRYTVERLALSSDLLSAQLSGTWHMAGNQHRSDVKLKIDKGDMGRLLDVFGFEKTIKDGTLNVIMDASWPAPLWGFEPGNIDGKLYVLIKDGQLLDIEPGASGRALGLLSIGKLPRRLTLDFSDFFGEGFNFERIAGNFVLDHGNAYTNDLEVNGPAAKIEISGRVGLTARDYDQLVTVTPYLESSLPLAGALAGGPAVGAAVIVAEKLLDGKLGLNKMASKQYTVSGPWDAPNVERISVDNGGNTDTEDLDDG